MAATKKASKPARRPSAARLRKIARELQLEVTDDEWNSNEPIRNEDTATGRGAVVFKAVHVLRRYAESGRRKARRAPVKR
jgi:hypothetical protein